MNATQTQRVNPDKEISVKNPCLYTFLGGNGGDYVNGDKEATSKTGQKTLLLALFLLESRH